MLAQFSEIAPKALLIGGMVWAGANWAYIGPELGSRTLRANGHIEMCKRGYAKNVLASAKEEIQKIPAPLPDPGREYAAQTMRGLINSPFGRYVSQSTQQFGIDAGGVLKLYEQEKKTAVATYKKALARAKEKTTQKLGKAGDVCGCVADEAVSLAQNEFALYSGTLTLFEPRKIADLGKLMVRAQASGACNHLQGVVQ